MEVLKQWFEQGRQVCKVYNFYDNKFIIYKGFKIRINEEGFYNILDGRFNDMYSTVSEKDLDVLKQFGFITGADLLSYCRDLKRVKKYEILIGKLYSSIEKLNKEDSKYRKKLNIYEKNISEAVDNMF